MATILVLGFAAGSAGAEGLLRPAASPLSAEKRLRLEADPYAMRWRVARLESDEVFEPGAWGRPLALNLFPDVQVKARVRSAKTLESGSRFLAGTLAGSGHFTLLRSAGGILRGEFHSGQGVFTMRSHGPQTVLVEQKDVSSLPGCGQDGAMSEAAVRLGARPAAKLPLTRPGNQRPARRLRRADAHSDESQPINVLVLYTQRVEDHEGGPDEVLITLENEIARMNQVLENSGLAHRRVRGFFEKVDYEQKEDLGADLNHLQLTEEDHERRNDGVDYSALDEVFPLIEKYQADLVHLFVRDSRGACGNAGVYAKNHEY